MSNKNQTKTNQPQLTGILGIIERTGNKIPHPIYMFIAFFFIVLGLSAVLAAAGFQTVNPVNNEEVSVVNLLTAAGIADILKGFPTEWAGFSPIGAVFVATLGLGVANGSGFLNGTLRLASNFKSKFLVTVLVVLIGINGNLIGDAAFVVFPPLIAILYMNLGRNPLAGLFTAYASVACGFGASLVVGNGDAMLAGMTETAAQMANEIKSISQFFLICFFACQFIAVFAKSNIGTIVAIKCGLFLKDSGIQGVGLFLLFVFLVALINLFVSSMSAKWAILSTVFVPMLLIAGISPAATQMAYRVGDSLTNNITPTFAYLGIILTYAQKYDRRAQTGTVIAYMLPFSISFTIVWVGLLIIWTLLGLPIGPGYHVFL